MNKKRAMFVSTCVELAERSPMTHKHGCIIVHGGKVIASGWNDIDDSMQCVRSIHAEVSAINEWKKLRKKKPPLKDCDIYVVRVGIDCLKNSKPCCMCQKTIEQNGGRNVYYSCGLKAV